MFTVRVIFTGLIAFVPGTEGDMTALLQNALSTSLRVSDGCLIPPHVPVVEIFGDCTPKEHCFRYDDSASVAGKRVLEALRNRGLFDSESGWVFAGKYSREHVEIRVPKSVTRKGKATPLGGSDEVVPVTGLRKWVGGGPSVFPSDSCEAKDISWIAQGGAIQPAATQVDRDCMGTEVATCDLAARIYLDRGSFATCSLAEHHGEAKVPSWDFRSLTSTFGNSSYVQALADSVVVSFEVEGKAIELVAMDFAKTEKAVAKIKPKDGYVDLVFGNIPADWRDETLRGFCASSRIARHFELYYNLTDVIIPWNRRPVPHARAETRPADGIQPSSCPPRKVQVPTCQERAASLLDRVWPGNPPSCDSFMFDSYRP